jgi:probable F420-dependent oxidoreductase
VAAELKVGIGFPGNMVGARDPDELDQWLEAVVEAGYEYISLGDHVLNLDPSGLSEARVGQWQRNFVGVDAKAPYDNRVIFREPFVLGTYFAGRCQLDIATGVLVLPQRQTALVAKQAAEVDILSRGRLRLAIGVGWNALEYSALGVPFAERQDIIEEQMVLLRKFWTEPIVNFEGKYHSVESSGIQVLPRRPIPLWIGGDGPRSLDRIGRLADGWLPPGRVQPGADAAAKAAAIRAAAEKAGRDPDEIGVEAQLFLSRCRTPDEIDSFVRAWRPQGLTHVKVETRGADPGGSVDSHIAMLREVDLDRIRRV